jgi:signal transduction histidine kinase
VDVRQVTDQAVSLFADEAEDRGVSLSVDMPDGLRVEADATRLRQVMANLIENAVKYSAEGGQIVLTATAEAGEVTWTVRDTGIGIGAEHLPFIWDRLYRADASRSARGLGLGLSLVKAIVEAHGGSVAVSSTPGAGSTFTVRLPATRHGEDGGSKHGGSEHGGSKHGGSKHEGSPDGGPRLGGSAPSHGKSKYWGSDRWGPSH